MSRWLSLGEELFSGSASNGRNSVRIVEDIVEDNAEAYLVIRIKLNSVEVVPDNQATADEKIENQKTYRETSAFGVFDVNASVKITRSNDNHEDPDSEINIQAHIKPKVPHTGGDPLKKTTAEIQYDSLEP